LNGRHLEVKDLDEHDLEITDSDTHVRGNGRGHTLPSFGGQDLVRHSKEVITMWIILNFKVKDLDRHPRR
jgi:hypothetical protein